MKWEIKVDGGHTSIPTYGRAAHIGMSAIALVAVAVVIWVWIALPEVMPVLMTPALWIAFLLAKFTGRRSRETIAERFTQARSEGYKGVVWIGGIGWRFRDGLFWRVLSERTAAGRFDVDDPFHRAMRIEEKRKFDLGQWGAAIVYPFFSGLIFVDRPEGATVEHVLGWIFLFLAIVTIVMEYVHQRGYQGFYGSMVFDPPPNLMPLEDIQRQKPLGDAHPNSEAEAVSAGSGSVRRSPVHDQKF